MPAKQIQEITSISDIQQLAASGFSDWKQYGEVSVDASGDLLIFNYTNKAQYEARWNFFERVSRGLMVNRRTGEVAARAFDKIFNWGERGLAARGHLVTVTEKVDGSLGILYREDGWRIATRGSFTSEQAVWATSFLNENFNLNGIPDEWTLLFEIIYPENRVVIDYAGERTLVLLAVRNRFTGDYLPFFPDLYELGQRLGFKLPRVFTFNNVTEILETAAALGPNDEGYVAEFSDGQRFKFKGDRYLELHRLIFGLSFKHTLVAVVGGSVDSIRSQIPDEFLGEFNGWVEEIESVVAETKRRAQAAFDAAPKTSRKEFALWALSTHKDLAPYLFALLDGKNIEPLIYKNEFENRPDEKAVHSSEATA